MLCITHHQIVYEPPDPWPEVIEYPKEVAVSIWLPHTSERNIVVCPTTRTIGIFVWGWGYWDVGLPCRVCGPWATTYKNGVLDIVLPKSLAEDYPKEISTLSAALRGLTSHSCL